MKMILAALILMIGNFATAAIVEKPIEYKDGETTLQGFMYYDDSTTEKRPGVLVIHAWTGLNDYAKERAKMLAEMGYVAFAGDIYGKGVNPKAGAESSAMSSKYKNDRPLFRKRVNLAFDQLVASEFTDPTRTAAIGYCFGGTAVLELARSGADVNGVVSFHGGLGTPTPEDSKNIKGSVLICHGADDPYVPREEVNAFHDEMRIAEVDYMVIEYSDAVHSFTEPGTQEGPGVGAAYDADADRRSWQHMQMFFDEIFKK